MADVGPILHDGWCTACEHEIHGEAAVRWWATETGRMAQLTEAIERIRVHHDRTLGHAPTNRIGYCAEPNGISATYCEVGILLAGSDSPEKP